MDLSLSIEEQSSDLAFAKHEAWEQIRELAREALKEMGETPASPLSHDDVSFD